MRYIITTIHGERFATDFEPALPVRDPDGNNVLVGVTYWCRAVKQVRPGRWEHQDAVHGRSFGWQDKGIVGVEDTDCG